MKKALVIFVFIILHLHAIEIDYGNGTFGMRGGFLGMSGEVNCDVSTFSITNRHDNIHNFYYGYNLVWYDSKRMVQAQKSYNAMAGSANGILDNLPTDKTATIPEMKYRLKGMDVNLQLGYDLLHQDDENYIGVGVLVGLSMPWIDSTKRGDATPNLGFMLDNADHIRDAANMFAKSKTNIMTYKIGPTISLQKSLIKKQLFVFGMASYAYQTGTIKNDYAHTELSVDGTFQSYNIGLQFIPFDHVYKWDWLTLSSKLYATIGYRYAKWDLGKVILDISGNQISSDILDPLAMEFSMESSIGYFGIGYIF